MNCDRSIKERKIEIEKPKQKMLKQIESEDKDHEVEPFDKLKLIKENLFLLGELDKLKKSNSSLSQRIYYLESIARVSPRKL